MGEVEKLQGYEERECNSWVTLGRTPLNSKEIQQPTNAFKTNVLLIEFLLQRDHGQSHLRSVLWWFLCVEGDTKLKCYPSVFTTVHACMLLCMYAVDN